MRCLRRPLLPQQRAMTLRGRDGFAHFHADCFLIWDDVRTQPDGSPAARHGMGA